MEISKVDDRAATVHGGARVENVIDIAVFMLGLSSAELTANWAQWWWWRFNGKARIAAGIPLGSRIMPPDGHAIVRLEFTSAFEMLDLVQRVSDHVGQTAGLDEDGVHWFGVAVRECVTNAISEPDAETGKEWISDLDVAFEPALRANRLAQMDLRREHVQAKAASA